MRVEPTGLVTVLTGVSPHGQGSETPDAQVVADALGGPLAPIEVVHGHTEVIPSGIGMFGSRSRAVGGAAGPRAVEKITATATQLAAYRLDVQPEAVPYGAGALDVPADPTRQTTLAEVALAATDVNGQPQGGVPAGLAPGLEATSRCEPTNGTCPCGPPRWVVEIAPETGQVALQRSVAVDDCGTVINPLMVDGPVHGGMAQGLGQALYAEVISNAPGQLVTGSWLAYAVPQAQRLPPLETARPVTPPPLHPLGAKGVGAAGTSGAAPAVAKAIIDALAPFGVTPLEMPLPPEKRWRLLPHGPHAGTSARPASAATRGSAQGKRSGQPGACRRTAMPQRHRQAALRGCHGRGDTKSVQRALGAALRLPDVRMVQGPSQGWARCRRPGEPKPLAAHKSHHVIRWRESFVGCLSRDMAGRDLCVASGKQPPYCTAGPLVLQ